MSPVGRIAIRRDRGCDETWPKALNDGSDSMHVLFVHKNFPAQFGHIARYLVQREGFRCAFISERPPGTWGGVQRIQYKTRGGTTGGTHYCCRTFENFTWHSHAVYETLKAHREIRPDLIVGHSGFGSTAFLAELYECPILNYFEYYYHTRNSEMDFRPPTSHGPIAKTLFFPSDTKPYEPVRMFK